MKRPEATAWSAWLAIAALRGVSPDAFWRLSFVEWRALAQPMPGTSLTRRDFEALASAFPDKT